MCSLCFEKFVAFDANADDFSGDSSGCILCCETISLRVVYSYWELLHHSYHNMILIDAFDHLCVLA